MKSDAYQIEPVSMYGLYGYAAQFRTPWLYYHPASNSFEWRFVCMPAR